MTNFEDLKKEKQRLRDEIAKHELAYATAKTGFNIGDHVEYIEDGEYVNGRIIAFNVGYDGDVYLDIYARHREILSTSANLYDPNKIRLRLMAEASELEVGDLFMIGIDKPRTTANVKYKVFKKEETYENITYWFHNDRNQPDTVYPGEYISCNN